MVTVGVLALQGDFAAHRRALDRLGLATRAVRKPDDLAAVDALVLPGGESTAMLHGLVRDGLEAPLRAVLGSGRPVLGTCAGAILLAQRVTNPPQRSFAALDIDVERNAYGTQVDSFAAPLDASGTATWAVRGVHPRAAHPSRRRWRGGAGTTRGRAGARPARGGVGRDLPPRAGRRRPGAAALARRRRRRAVRRMARRRLIDSTPRASSGRSSGP